MSQATRPPAARSKAAASLRLRALPALPWVRAGDDLAALLIAALRRARLSPAADDVLVVAQKVVSKAEGRLVPLASVSPSPRALQLAAQSGKDARLVELVLRESRAVLRVAPGRLIVEHRLGLVHANAGIDQSNLEPGDEPAALLLPVDPDASAAALRERLAAACGAAPAVVISDSTGRAFRHGVVSIAIGCSGLVALWDRVGERDLAGRALAVTEVALADQVAAAAGLLMGEAGEGLPAVLLSGLSMPPGEAAATVLQRPAAEDLFR